MTDNSIKAPWRCDYEQFSRMLAREKPERPVLFELMLNEALVRQVTGLGWASALEYDIALMQCNGRLGYDCSIVLASDFHFPQGARKTEKTASLNEGAVISDRADFERYDWPEAAAFAPTRLDKLQAAMPEGMKLLIWSPDGLLEAVVRMVGYENLCMMLYDDPDLFDAIFMETGKRIYDYFVSCVGHPAVGGIISSDDWGFYSQTLFPPDVLRRVVMPWQWQFVTLAREHGKHCILHSCGNLQALVPDIILAGFHAKHSFEDKILPVEQALEGMGRDIAILGGIDVDFMCAGPPQRVYDRAARLLKRTACRGYALGTGNSVPDYVPSDNYFAMLQAAYDAFDEWDRL